MASPMIGRSPSRSPSLAARDLQGGRKDKSNVSRNVYVTIAMCIVWGFGESIWTGTILAAWLYDLAGGNDPNKDADANTVVGFIEAASGFSGILTALPVGYMADKYGRSPTVKVGSVGFVLATILTLYAILADVSNHDGLVLLTIAWCVWGFSGGVFNGPMQALFAESVPEGDRSYWYSVLSMAFMLPSIAGPLLSICLFQVYGDNWTLNELRPIFALGVCIEVVPAMLACFLRDDLALPESRDEAENVAGGEEDVAADEAKKGYVLLGKRITKESIPYLLFIGDLLTAVGSGMTVKFFPLFFKNEIGLSPSATQGIYVILPLLMSGCVVIAQRASYRLGRVQTIFGCRVVAVALLLLLTYLVDTGITNWYIIVPVYLVRSAIANCSYPLDESVLMDNVPKSTRARWKTLESVSMFGWCGSAFIGGYLADQFSYNFTFLITAILQLLAGIPMVMIMPVVKEEVPSSQQEQESGTLEEPLLSTA